MFDVEQIWSKITDFRDIDRSTIEAIIAEGSRLSAQTLFESFQESKHSGCDWNGGQVLAKEFKNAFKELIIRWVGLSGNPRFGGLGMPKMLGCLIEDVLGKQRESLPLTL